MGLPVFRRGERALRIVQSLGDPPMELSSPWVTGSLSPLPWADIFGTDVPGPMRRIDAIGIPAVMRGRGLLAPTIAGTPLHCWAGETRSEDPSWLFRTDGIVSPFTRMEWTVDDLIFTGWSLWAKEVDAAGFPLRMDRVERSRWYIDDGGQVMVDGSPVDAASVVIIPGPHDGILDVGRRTLTTAAELEAAVAKTARSPIPGIDLHQTTDVELTAAEKQTMITDWVAARRGENGGVAFTNSAVEARVLGSPVENLLIEGRNASAVDIARLMNIPAALIDATNAGASLTYETVGGRNAEFLDYGLLPYMRAIAGRLSLDDVVPRGKRVEFDTADLTAVTPVATGPTLED